MEKKYIILDENNPVAKFFGMKNGWADEETYVAVKKVMEEAKEREYNYWYGPYNVPNKTYIDE